jgi:hypothetical protein
MVRSSAIAADAHADGARRAALALRIPHRVQDALAHAFDGAIGATKIRQLGWQRVLDVQVGAHRSDDQSDDGVEERLHRSSV